MRIWFELTNSPHINMFAAMIRELEKEHEVIITCRPLANTVELLDLHGFKYEVIGLHYGGKFWTKLMGYPIRVWQLYRYISKKNVDVAVAQCSYHLPIVARLCGAPSVYLNDNEHAVANSAAYLFANVIMVPEFLPSERLKYQLADPRKIVHYPGVKEGIFLWELEQRLPAKVERQERKKIYIRTEPWTAHYYKESRNFLDDLIIQLKDKVDIVLLPRGNAQAVHYKDKKFDGIQVAEKALDIYDIVPHCDLFIGAGGTMTREMAVMGVPTISVYQADLLDVDRHLIEIGAYVHQPNLTAEQVLHVLESAAKKPANRDLLEKGKAAYELIKNTILKVAK
ncbi:putative glycosyltransferase [Oxalobacteraceae bacterium GrIS 2.11]